MTTTQTPEDRAIAKANKARRKQEIAAKSIVTKVILEHSIDVCGICDGSDNPGLLRELNFVEEMQKTMPDGTTIGQACIMYLEAKLAKLKANQ